MITDLVEILVGMERENALKILFGEIIRKKEYEKINEKLFNEKRYHVLLLFCIHIWFSVFSFVRNFPC